MKWLIYLVNFILVELDQNRCSVALFRTSRITHGELVEQGKYPFIVSIQRNGSHFCSGSIINKNTIVTAAHCVFDQRDNIAPISVLASISDLLDEPRTVQRRSLDKIIIHKSYIMSNDRRSVNDDVALLKLTWPLNLDADESIKSISLPKRNVALEQVGDEIIVAGWGSHIVSEPVATSLFQASMKIASYDRCFSIQPGVLRSNKVFCAEGYTSKDACRGDSGSPLFFVDKLERHVLIGVMSYGKPCGMVYTRLSFYLNWIIENLE